MRSTLVVQMKSRENSFVLYKYDYETLTFFCSLPYNNYYRHIDYRDMIFHIVIMICHFHISIYNKAIQNFV